MLLRNYYNNLAHLALGESFTYSAYGDNYISYKTLSGTYPICYSGFKGVTLGNITYSIYNNSGGADSADYAGICFGTGDTAVTFDDYRLASIIGSSSLTIGSKINKAATYDATNKTWTKAFQCVLTNLTSSELVIQEVGIAGTAYASGYPFCLLYREVLDTPITIAANESIVYTHNFEFTMPTIS